MTETGSVLSRIAHPDAVRFLSREEKDRLAEEIRQTIVNVVSRNGGHLASSLGVVELSLALLTVLDADHDKVVWDVGHQAYAWKLLTGRKEQFHTLRQFGGVSGFPRRAESRYDHFGVGHSSTSVSAALGMAMARDLSTDPAERASRVVAVIGDGALTAGMAFEGLNQAGDMGRKLIVVLNDNEMSISRNVGALSLFLSRNMARGWARRIRREVKEWLKTIPGIGEDVADYVHRTHRSLKTVFTPGMLFEAFRFNYIGPVDGHDLDALEEHLRMAASIDDQPVLLHVLTRKGKGYAPAENAPSSYHGLGRFSPADGTPEPAPAGPSSWTTVFGDTLCALGHRDPRVVAITAAMTSGTGTGRFHAAFPERFVDVGICEQHAITFAAGLATQGLRPFVAVYSTFAQRAYDQIVHDVCLQNLPVTICLDRAGLVGEDGPTHHGVFDIAFLRHIPNMNFIAPRDEGELQRALILAPQLNAPLAIRYPRGAGVGIQLPEISPDPTVPLPDPLPVGEGELLRADPGSDILLLPIGNMVQPALEAANRLAEQGHAVSVFDSRWIKPLPAARILELVAAHSRICTIEEGCLPGGFGSAILELLATHNVLSGKTFRRLGVPDSFVEHGSVSQLRALCGLTPEGIVHEVTRDEIL